jgi:PhnB protein
VVAGAARAIDSCTQILGAEDVERHTDPSGKIVHAEPAIAGARMTLKDEDVTRTDRSIRAS